jgi:hypothetical protein
LLEFEFGFDSRYKYLLRSLGVRPGNSFVVITDADEFYARFGRWQVKTAMANLAGYQRSGGYNWWKAIGIRGSLADHGLTFGTNTREGLCVEFVEKIPALVAGRRHPGLTVTVADVDGLAAALERHGIAER